MKYSDNLLSNTEWNGYVFWWNNVTSCSSDNQVLNIENETNLIQLSRQIVWIEASNSSKEKKA